MVDVLWETSRLSSHKLFLSGFQVGRYGSGFTSGEGIIDGKGRDASADSNVQPPHCFLPSRNAYLLGL